MKITKSFIVIVFLLATLAGVCYARPWNIHRSSYLYNDTTKTLKVTVGNSSTSYVIPSHKSAVIDEAGTDIHISEVTEQQ